ncbi:MULTISPECIES: transcription antitermination factor NusB [Marinobacter]|uniref:Transcription antitermination protein NusB n=1 Tax=Marinobacter xestospongiae TaxID=994319 RepID=A0ABU3W2X0_9GAMM|nr:MULTISPECIES: transcription antitermination factor NusB [Marinobacter]MCG8520543.1 transcription antitermination factor NusB [Pseudomonadales bacterium]MCK7568830.1 transcription antitermination factor NusB [Marinobacter xestospongiae]MDV2080874.1 transcription antitermination factor NusB [Marinobacter xestospongiae]UDL04393.1 transcription antitermination factor NusB [Marinobacter sp. CA1]
MSDSDQTSPKPAGQPKAGDRRRARALAMQALYQRHFSKTPVSDIEAEFMVDNDMSKVDTAYFRDLLRGVHREQDELDRLLEPLLDRPLAEVDAIELAIVRLGAYELKHRIDVPYRVVINEGIEMAKRFGGTEGHKFVNSILDKLSGRLRLAETRSR